MARRCRTFIQPTSSTLLHQSFCLSYRGIIQSRLLREAIRFTQHPAWSSILDIRIHNSTIPHDAQTAIKDRNIGATERLKTPNLPRKFFCRINFSGYPTAESSKADGRRKPDTSRLTFLGRKSSASRFSAPHLLTLLRPQSTTEILVRQ